MKKNHLTKIIQILLIYFMLNIYINATDQTYMLMRVYTKDYANVAKTLNQKGFDIAGINRYTGWVEVIGTEKDKQALIDLGYNAEIIDYSHPLNAKLGLPDYKDPSEISSFMDQVQANYPSIAKKVLIKGPLYENHYIYAMKISDNVDQDEDEPAFILDAQHHAREVMTTEVAWDMIDYLTSRYSSDPEVQNWVNNIEIWVIPSVNPDGSNYVFTVNNMWRKNRNPVCQADLNRNYSFNWNGCNGSSGTCSSDTYRGPSPESELETQGMVDLFHQKHPIFNLTYHSYGEYIMWSYGCTDPDENAALGELGYALNNMLQNDNGQTGQYATGPIWSTIYSADGSSLDDIYGEMGTFAYVIEVNSSSFQPDYATWRDITVQRQRTAWKFFLDHTVNTPSIQGHVRDANTLQPLEANISIQEINYTHGEWQRKSYLPFGRYFWVTQSNHDYHITFSKDGYISQTHTVHVGTNTYWLDVNLVPISASYAQYVVGSAALVGEPSGGDNDAFPDNCETANAKVSVKSVGTGTAIDVIVNITSNDPFITIITPMPIYVGNIPSQQTADVNFSYAVGIGQYKASCQQSATFNITVQATGQSNADQNSFSFTNEIDQSIGNKSFAFENNLEGWTIQQGTWQLSTNRVNPGGSTKSLHSSQNLNNQCDVILSPEIEPTASTQLTIPNWYQIENQSGYWYDRANIHVIQGTNRTLISPSSGKTYQTGSYYNYTTCGIGSEPGWAGTTTGNFWGNSIFNLNSFAEQKIQLEIRYFTDGYTVYEGIYVDDISLSNVKISSCDAYPDQCTTNNPPGRIANTLVISKGTSQLTLTWNAPPAPCITSTYSIYRGTLPFTNYTYEQIDCDVPQTYYYVPFDLGSYYYLVVAQNENKEGSFGKKSDGSERPNNNACTQQQIGTCN